MDVNNIFKYLIENDYIEYGRIFSKNLCETIFKMDYVENDIQYVGHMLKLMGFITEKGYPCTTRGAPEGGFRIVGTHEIDKQCKNKQDSAKRKLNQTKNCLMNCDRNALTKEEISKINHETNKILASTNALRSVLGKYKN